MGLCVWLWVLMMLSAAAGMVVCVDAAEKLIGDADGATYERSYCILYGIAVLLGRG